MKASVVYSTSPRIEDHKEILQLDVVFIIGGLMRVVESLMTPAVMDQVPDNWTQLTVTITR